MCFLLCGATNLCVTLKIALGEWGGGLLLRDNDTQYICTWSLASYSKVFSVEISCGTLTLWNVTKTSCYLICKQLLSCLVMVCAVGSVVGWGGVWRGRWPGNSHFVTGQVLGLSR